MARSSNYAEQDIDVENSGNTVSLEINARTEVRIEIDGESGNEFEFQVRRPGGSWITGVNSYTGSANYSDTRSEPAHEVRIKCTSGTSNANDTATITLIAS